MKINSGLFSTTTGWNWDQNGPTQAHAESPRSTLLLAFGSPELLDDTAALGTLMARYPNAHVLGASSYGVIVGNQNIDDSIHCTALEFEYSELVSAYCEVSDINESETAGRTIGKKLMQKSGLRGILVLADGLTVNGTQLLAGLKEQCPNIPIAGGMAGDGTRFQSTRVIYNGVAQQKIATAIGFYGEHLVFTRGCKAGPIGFGPLRQVTKSVGNVVFEIDNQPALQLYKTYLGELAKQLPGAATYFPLSLRRSSSSETPLIRSVLGIDEENQSITVAGDMPEGSYTQLMRASQSQLLLGAQHAIDEATEDLPKDLPVLGLTVSCFGRRVLLGERTDDEIEIIHDTLPKLSQHTGFFSYGEISSFDGGQCDFHNMTLALTTLAEYKPEKKNGTQLDTLPVA